MSTSVMALLKIAPKLVKDRDDATCQLGGFNLSLVINIDLIEKHMTRRRNFRSGSGSHWNEVLLQQLCTRTTQYYSSSLLLTT